MLYLAQVQAQGLLGKLGLRLLACQEAEYNWVLVTEKSAIPDIESILDDRAPLPLSEGLLVLVEIASDGQIYNLQNAADWVLKLVHTYLSNGVTPQFLQQEAERAEQWRQRLTLQAQELARRSLEVEARREQIQALEESLIRDQETNNPAD